MKDLLHPSSRIPKATKLDQDMVIDIGPRVWDGKEERKLAGFTLRVPAGATAGNVGNFQHKSFVLDLVTAKLNPDRLEKRLADRVGAENAHRVARELQGIADVVILDPGRLGEAVKAARERLPILWQVYSSCTEETENRGHRFGEDLPETDKNALIAFLATL
jgi:hypothetical protein